MKTNAQMQFHVSKTICINWKTGFFSLKNILKIVKMHLFLSRFVVKAELALIRCAKRVSWQNETCAFAWYNGDNSRLGTMRSKYRPKFKLEP